MYLNKLTKLKIVKAGPVAELSVSSKYYKEDKFRGAECIRDT